MYTELDAVLGNVWLYWHQSAENELYKVTAKRTFQIIKLSAFS